MLGMKPEIGRQGRFREAPAVKPLQWKVLCGGAGGSVMTLEAILNPRSPVYSLFGMAGPETGVKVNCCSLS
jgi:hypothetical protein